MIARMLKGMVMRRSRQAIFQCLNENTRSILRPAPIKAMITTNSVSRSVI
jgi:hypothetical protein